MFGAQAELLVEAVREVLGGTWRVRAELGGDERRRAPTAPAPRQPAPRPAAPAPGASPAATPAGGPPTGDRPTDAGRLAGDRGRLRSGTEPVRRRPAPARPAGAGRRRPAPRPNRPAAPAPAAPAPAPPRADRARRAEPPVRTSSGDEPPCDPEYDAAATTADDAAPGAGSPARSRRSGRSTEHFGVERIGDAKPRA